MDRLLEDKTIGPLDRRRLGRMKRLRQRMRNITDYVPDEVWAAIQEEVLGEETV